MSAVFPSERTARKMNGTLSGDNAVNTTTITVSPKQFGVIWKLTVDIDVASETDLENLVASATISVVIGNVIWPVEVHPFIAHDDGTTFFRHVDLGPWQFDFGADGLYSGKKGDDIVVTVDAMGAGIKSRTLFLYSGG